MKISTIPFTHDRAARQYLQLAYIYANLMSDDARTKVGAVIVEKNVAYGTNRYKDGITAEEIQLIQNNDKQKYSLLIHAEADAIQKAQKRDIDTARATLYAPWFSCKTCTDAILDAKIPTVIGHKQLMDNTPQRWRSELEESLERLHNARVLIAVYDGNIGGCTNLFNGTLWHP